MSRSKKKIPILGNGCCSDKEGKQKANRALRVRVKNILRTNFEKDLPLLREVSDRRGFTSDGKRFRKNFNPKQMRK